MSSDFRPEKNVTREIVSLKDISDYVSVKTSVTELTLDNYISTENMLPNKEGITLSSGLPNANLTTAYNSNDILVSNIRPYFKKIWFAKSDGGCSNDVLVLRAKSNCLPEFLFYALSEDAFFDYSTSTSKGTKMPRGDKTAIMNYNLNFPNLSEQKQIVSILSSLYEKIELNNKINDNLEQIAQAIFKSWFIDFEPFNDEKFVESELGLIPEGWKIGTLSKMILTNIGGDWGKEKIGGNYTEEVYCIRGADLPDIKKGNSGKMPTRFILPQNLKNKKLFPGDLVVEISGGSPTQSTGRIALISSSLLNRFKKDMVCTNFCKAMKPVANYSNFVYYYWQNLYIENRMFSYENGTTGIKNFDITSFLNGEIIIIPPFEFVQKFDETIIGISKIIFDNSLQSEKLRMLRDSLLPKIMSGEINVSQVKI